MPSSKARTLLRGIRVDSKDELKERILRHLDTGRVGAGLDHDTAAEDVEKPRLIYAKLEWRRS